MELEHVLTSLNESILNCKYREIFHNIWLCGKTNLPCGQMIDNNQCEVVEEFCKREDI